MTTSTGTSKGETTKRRPFVPPSPLVRVSLAFSAIAGLALVFADLEITVFDPWPEMGRLALGLVTPDFLATEHLARAILNTIAFAILGVAVGNVLGFVLALMFHSRAVRLGCALVRAVHELFWGLIFLQILGLTPLTGVLAIAIPYAGIIAKVYAEILEEADPAPLKALPWGTDPISALLFVRIPDVWVHFKNYSFYRFECGLRSSAVLGFIGLPTLGFHLETAFKQGHYSEVSALLILFYLVIATIRFWVRRELLPIYLVGAVWVLPPGAELSWSNAWRFLASDVVPAPLRGGGAGDGNTMTRLGEWAGELLVNQALPGVANTVILTMIALVGAGMTALLFFPLESPRFLGRGGRGVGHVFLVVVRSTPEYVLAYVLLQLWGPSMIPAVVALSLHNGAIIGHLIGRYTGVMPHRQDSATGINHYAYEVLPRVYPQFLAFLFYRWEVIMRETAILGILGIHTLGFFVDSAFADIRFDRAFALILVTALLNIGVDALSRTIRSRLRLQTTPDFA